MREGRTQDTRQQKNKGTEQRCKSTTPDGGASFQGKNLITPKHTTVPGGSSMGLHMSPRDPHSKCTSVSPNHRINHHPHYWIGRHVHAHYSLRPWNPRYSLGVDYTYTLHHGGGTEPWHLKVLMNHYLCSYVNSPKVVTYGGPTF